MASWKEIERIRKDAGGFRALADRIVRLTAPDALTEWETTFLQAIAASHDTIEFTNRQSEKLLQIRDDVEQLDKVRGFNVRTLIEGCYLARLDLSEDREEWIATLRQSGVTTIRRKEAGKLLRCACDVGLIDSHNVVAA